MNIAHVGQSTGSQFDYNNSIHNKQTNVSGIKNSMPKNSSVSTNSNANIIVNYYKKEFSNLADMGNEEIKSTVQSVLSKMGEHDYISLMKQGVSPESLELDFLLVSIEQIKETRGIESIAKKDRAVNLSESLLKSANKICPDTDIINKLADAFGNHNVPVNETNLVNGLNAFNKLDKFGNLSSEAIDYLLKQGKLPTIENIYKAQHVNSKNVDNTSNITDQEWTSLSSQVDNVLVQEGLEVKEETKNIARDLISKDIPVTKENIIRSKELHNININENIDRIIDNITDAIKNGKSAEDALVISSVKQIYEDVKQTLNEVQDVHVRDIIKSGDDLTIKQLKKEIEGSQLKQVVEPPTIKIQGKQTQDKQGKDKQTQDNTKQKENYTQYEIKAKRQIEEIRLRLTLDAASKLCGKGFNIETEELEKVVKQLRDLELNVAKQTLEVVQVDRTTSNIELMKDTVAKINEIKALPLYTIGRVPLSGEVTTLNVVLLEGNILANQLKNQTATSSYDTMMTVPRQDLGDSLTKAFANISSIIADLGLEDNEANQKAVKILAYNQIEMNEENINKVKQLYQTVIQALKNITPGVAAYMIKQGINPLNTEINLLNKKVNEMKDEYGLTQQEKIGKFIVQSEKSGNITQEERKSLVGLYRLISTINKTQGKAVGMLMKQGREITLTSLLSATKLLKTKGVNVEVNDGFGALEKVEYKNEAITTQLENIAMGQAIESEEAKIMYQQEILANIMDSVSPSKLKEIAKRNDILSMSLEKFSEVLDEYSNEVFNEEETVYAKEKLNKIQELQSIHTKTFEFLQDYNLPNSVKNLLAAQMVLQQDYSLYKDIKTKLSALGSDSKRIDDIIDDFDKEGRNSQSVNDSLEKIDNLLDYMLDEAIDKQTEAVELEKIIDLKNNVNLLKELGQQKYFQIPFNINGNTMQLNIKLEKGAGEVQNIKASVETQTLGNVNINLEIEGGKATIQVTAESTSQVKVLKESKARLVEIVENIGLIVKDVNYNVESKPDRIIGNGISGYSRNGFEVVI